MGSRDASVWSQEVYRATFPVRAELFNSSILFYSLLVMSGILESKSKEPEYVVEKIGDGAGDDEKLGTVRDKTDMHRLGKLQELRVSESDVLDRGFADLTTIAAKVPFLLYHRICYDSWLYLGICIDVG